MPIEVVLAVLVYSLSIEDSCLLFDVDDDDDDVVVLVGLDGVDPDDSFSSVPYEKGFTLLYTLESIVGHEAFEQWAKEKYIQTFKYKTVTTYEFIALFLETFADNETIANFEWEKWFKNKPYLCN